MRKFLSVVLIAALSTLALPVGIGATESSAVAITGIAYTTSLRPLPNARVQIRNVQTGDRVNSAVSDAAGEFSFRGMGPGTYVVELVDATGRVLGMTGPVTLAPGATANISIVEIGDGSLSAGSGGGFSLLGLGPVASLAVIGAAGAAAVTAVVATRPDASPSR